ncbi:cytokine receptor common subunit beta [Eucyclogobius newberryi]|uniref:cytokine receptor common subunit beta n=1 Tax=Eucyclogobius newberryi TaxID=166745 RepID=UPI003B58FE6A
MLLLCFLCLPWVLSAADRCALSNSSHTASPILTSLQCYNDYMSYFHCTWRDEPGRRSTGRLKLWLQTKRGGAGLCEERASDDEGFTHCRYKTKLFSSATIYTAFFKETLSLCSTGHTTSRDLSTLLRTRAPVGLSTSSTAEGGRLITWSSPYPQSSPLNDNITFQLNYRPDDHDDWTWEELWHNQKKLEKKRLIPGVRYEARVRARVRAGQWSHWSALVSWHTPPGVGTAPPVDCVLWDEQEVQCSWEQSVEQLHFISFQLLCRDNSSSPLDVCCEPAVSVEHKEHREDRVRFSCLLNLTLRSTSDLQVALVPTRNTKRFCSSKHIRPRPPTHVRVTDRGNSWTVAWTPPQMPFSEFESEMCYYSHKMEAESDVCSDAQLLGQRSKQDIGILRVPRGSSSGTIGGPSLLPSHTYRVKVRTRVTSPYEGTPSDWSAPAEWTSRAALWPVSFWIYCSAATTGLFLAFFLLPACRRKTLLWAESVPSPGKSKALLDLQTVKKHEFYLCKVLDMDSVSTCSSSLSLWSPKSPDSREEEEDEEDEQDDGIWSCENLPVSPLDKSSLSFTGPYIFCQAVESRPEGDMSEVSSCPDVGRPATERTVLFEEAYVCLPSHTVCRSVQDLTFQSHGSTEEEHSRAEEEHSRAEEGHSRAEEGHSRAEEGHSGAEEEHSRAEEGHSRAEEEHSSTEEEHSSTEEGHSGAEEEHSSTEEEHSSTEEEHSGAEEEHSRAEEEHSGAEEEHSGAEEEHSRADAEEEHSGAEEEHSRAEEEHSRAEEEHSRAEEEHSGAEEEHSGAEEEHICLNQDYASDTFWPQEGATPDRGYCHLPTVLSLKR